MPTANCKSLAKYLLERYGSAIKYLVTSVFMLQSIVYNSIVLYLPALALESTLGLSRFYSILLIGLLCVMYSGIGGVKAVVWTDFFQAFLMYSALIVVGALGTYDAGGIGQVLDRAAAAGRFNWDGFLNLDLTTRHTLAGILIGNTLKSVYLVGANQVQLQRALSLPTIRHGQYAFIICSIASALIVLLSSYTGAVVVAAYNSCDPYLAGEITRRDAIVLHYVAHRLAAVPGFRGIFVAGLFSATLSTLSSFANSMAALALEDFICPIRGRLNYSQMSNSTGTKLAKILATIFGLICVLVAYAIEQANSRLLQASTTLHGAIGTPFVAAYALGIFTRFANTIGIVSGFVVTFSLGIYVIISQVFFSPPLQPTMPVFYNDQCECVFNQTLAPSKLVSYADIAASQLHHQQAPPFALDKLSYMSLPIVQFVLMIVVTSIVSLATGGLNQQVDDKYLVSVMRRKSRSGDQVFAKQENNCDLFKNNQKLGQSVAFDHLPKGTWSRVTSDTKLENNLNAKQTELTLNLPKQIEKTR